MQKTNKQKRNVRMRKIKTTTTSWVAVPYTSASACVPNCMGQPRPFILITLVWVQGVTACSILWASETRWSTKGKREKDPKKLEAGDIEYWSSSQGDRTTLKALVIPTKCSFWALSEPRAGVRRDSSSNPGDITFKLGNECRENSGMLTRAIDDWFWIVIYPRTVSKSSVLWGFCSSQGHT